MKKGRFTEEQIVRILQQAERGEQTIGARCREHGIAETLSIGGGRNLVGLGLLNRSGSVSWKKNMPG